MQSPQTPNLRLFQSQPFQIRNIQPAVESCSCLHRGTVALVLLRGTLGHGGTVLILTHSAAGQNGRTLCIQKPVLKPKHCQISDLFLQQGGGWTGYLRLMWQFGEISLPSLQGQSKSFSPESVNASAVFFFFNLPFCNAHLSSCKGNPNVNIYNESHMFTKERKKPYRTESQKNLQGGISAWLLLVGTNISFVRQLQE